MQFMPAAKFIFAAGFFYAELECVFFGWMTLKFMCCRIDGRLDFE